MKLMISRVLWLAAILLFPAGLFGQMIPSSVETIDAHVLNAETIIIGTVRECHAHTDSDADLVVNIEETIKGTPQILFDSVFSTAGIIKNPPIAFSSW
jgi:hypothetical protein